MNGYGPSGLFTEQADPEVIEEWKWREVPVWSHPQSGMICTAETYKNVLGRALNGRQKSDFGTCMQEVFQFIVGNLQGIRLIDPANSNNEIEMSYADRSVVVAKATQALNAPYWSQVVW